MTTTPAPAAARSGAWTRPALWSTSKKERDRILLIAGRLCDTARPAGLFCAPTPGRPQGFDCRSLLLRRVRMRLVMVRLRHRIELSLILLVLIPRRGASLHRRGDQ